MPGLDEAPEEALPLEELALDPRDHVPPPAQHPHPDDEAESAGDTAAADQPGGEVDDERPEAVDDAEQDAPAAEAPTAPTPATRRPRPSTARPTAPRPDARARPRAPSRSQRCPRSRRRALRRDRTQPVRQTERAGAGRDADGATEAHDDGHELIEEQVAPTATSPERPAASRPTPRKGGRPSVPSWDDIMFGRKGD